MVKYFTKYLLFWPSYSLSVLEGSTWRWWPRLCALSLFPAAPATRYTVFARILCVAYLPHANYMEQWAGSKLDKEHVKAIYCYPAYLTYMQSTSCKILGWMKHKLESRLLGEISITSDEVICRQHHPNGKKWRRTKEPLDEGERREWKSCLKTQHSKTKIMASSPITSWQIERENVEAVTDFIFLGPKITGQWLHPWN